MIQEMTENNNRGIKINYESLFHSGPAYDPSGKQEKDQEELYTTDQVKKILSEKEEEWNLKLESEVKAASENAFREGFESGVKKARKELNESVGSVMSALKSVDSHLEDLMNQVKPHIAGMAFDIAEKILALPVKNEILNERVTNEIEQIINELESSTRVIVDVAEPDLETVREKIGEMQNTEHIVLRASADLQPGEYRVDTNSEQIVKQFRKKLKDFRESISLAEDDN